MVANMSSCCSGRERNMVNGRKKRNGKSKYVCRKCGHDVCEEGELAKVKPGLFRPCLKCRGTGEIFSPKEQETFPCPHCDDKGKAFSCPSCNECSPNILSLLELRQ